MIVVGDTGPLNYLVLIGQEGILPVLFSAVSIPEAVARELAAPAAPDQVRDWIASPPSWLHIHPDPPEDPTLTWLDFGERAAIVLAIRLAVPEILIDDMDARIQAEQRNLKATGTLGVLVAAHRRRLLNFDEAILRLQATSFYLSPGLLARVRRLL